MAVDFCLEIHKTFALSDIPSQ